MNVFEFDRHGNCRHYAEPIATRPAEHGRLQIKRLIAKAWLDQRLNYSPRCFEARARSLEAIRCRP